MILYGSPAGGTISRSYTPRPNVKAAVSAAVKLSVIEPFAPSAMRPFAVVSSMSLLGVSCTFPGHASEPLRQ